MKSEYFLFCHWVSRKREEYILTSSSWFEQFEKNKKYIRRDWEVFVVEEQAWRRNFCSKYIEVDISSQTSSIFVKYQHVLKTLKIYSLISVSIYQVLKKTMPWDEMTKEIKMNRKVKISSKTNPESSWYSIRKII